jgi:hypothetical protein
MKFDQKFFGREIRIYDWFFETFVFDFSRKITNVNTTNINTIWYWWYCYCYIPTYYINDLLVFTAKNNLSTASRYALDCCELYNSSTRLLTMKKPIHFALNLTFEAPTVVNKIISTKYFLTKCMDAIYKLIFRKQFR